MQQNIEEKLLESLKNKAKSVTMAIAENLVIGRKQNEVVQNVDGNPITIIDRFHNGQALGDTEHLITGTWSQQE